MDIVGIIFIVFAVFVLLYGLSCGFADMLIHLVLTSAALGGAAALSYLFADAIPFLVEFIPDKYLRIGVMFLVLALVLIGLMAFINWAIHKLFRKVGALRWIDRILGAVVGVGFVYVLFGTMFAVSSISLGNENVDKIVTTVLDAIHGSSILKLVYGAANPVGESLIGLLPA